MFDIIKLLIPLIPVFIELIGKKKKQQMAMDPAAAVDCWLSPDSQWRFIQDACDGAVALRERDPTKGISASDAPATMLAMKAFADDPLLEAFVASLYAMPEMAEAEAA